MLRIKGRIIVSGLFLVTGLMAQDTVKRHGDFGHVPLYLEENRGQTDAHARYVARSTSLRRGVFYWQPGPGFLGEHNLVFEQKDGTEVQVSVTCDSMQVV